MSQLRSASEPFEEKANRIANPARNQEENRFRRRRRLRPHIDPSLSFFRYRTAQASTTEDACARSAGTALPDQLLAPTSETPLTPEFECFIRACFRLTIAMMIPAATMTTIAAVSPMANGMPS